MKKMKKNYYWCAILIVVVLVLVLLGVATRFKDDQHQETTSTYEAQQYRTFVQDMSDYVDQVDTSMDYDTARSELISEVMKKQKTFEDGDGVGYASNLLVNTIATDVSKDTGTLLDSLSSVLEGLFNLDFGNSNSKLTTTLTMRSNTVCNDGNIDGKYCVEKLSAKVYIADVNSDKWAVLIHGNMMNGKQMYSAVGDMYIKQGYNIVAPDLRGAGDSDGSVAMGYLESLDVYDWVKDLNDNWQSKYAVNIKPNTIIVHGISLGGATTLQLATNPDIASASGQEPYTRNLTQLNVKGFVDDCGYASMTGIIKGMLSLGDSAQISSILGSLNIGEIDFMSELKKQAEKLDIKGLKDIDINSLISGQDKDYLKYFEQFNNEFNKVSEELKKYESSNGTYEVPGLDIDTIKDKLSGFLPTSATGNAKVFGVNNTLDFDSSSILDGLIGKVLISLVGVGLNEQNYDKYSNVFSEGRHFPQGSKVVIIHGTADTIVPHEQADIVASNIAPAVLLHKWDVSEMPHAFIVVGFNKNEYSNLIANFANCVVNSNCTSITR